MADKLMPEGQTKPSRAEQASRSKPTAAAATEASATAAASAASTTPARPVAKGTSADPDKTPAAGASGASGQPEQLREPNVWIREALRQTPSWLVSMVVHMVLLLALALLTLPEGVTDELRQLVIAPEEEEQLDDLEELEYEPPEQIDVSTELSVVETEIEPKEVPISPADDVDAAAVAIKLSEFGFDRAPRNDLLATAGAYSGDGLSGRGAKARGGLVKKHGGTPESEKAVAAALRWLAEHQLYDGGWSFEHTRAPRCGAQCRNPGNLGEARIGATAMALLPFLGAGQTHKSGTYQKTVKNGLSFLISKMKRTPQGGNMWESGGRMYSHGLASITLCEAYAMTQDKALHQPAQQALDFICYAQDPVGGGWRYDPQERGDTSVVGWQIMALKSGHMAYLRVPPITIKKAYQFLDSVQSNSGASYGYTAPNEKRQATTAVGLLCRMYLGWKKDHQALGRGVDWLSSTGPSKGDMYFNYYATQVMRHWEGDEWKKWNDVMRDQLVNSQAKRGHETGSWYIARGDLGADRGGRLYCTSMATMILEVYYRHLPIYRKQSTEEDFPE